MKNLITIALVIIMCIGSLKAQEIQRSVICVNGNYVSDGNIQLSQTIGEPIAQTFTSVDGNTLISQGFEQKLPSNFTTSFENFEIDVALYPNPTNDFVYLNFSTIINENIQLEIYGADGKLFGSQTALQQSTIDLSYLAAGTYFIRLLNQEGHLINKAIPIQKLN